jgi:hypothetical protein
MLDKSAHNIGCCAQCLTTYVLMSRILFLFAQFLSLFVYGQELSTKESIDSVVLQISRDISLERKICDTVYYTKNDGGDTWDSLYSHREYFYKNGRVVKVLIWKKYGAWRHDILCFFYNGKAVMYLMGEGFKSSEYYGKLNFSIYYYQDTALAVNWLTPKPSNVVGIGTDIYIEWANYFLLEATRNRQVCFAKE